MAKKIVGNTPPLKSTKDGIGRSLLMELCEDGQQMVKITKLHKKYTKLMFPEDNVGSKYLDDYVSPPPLRPATPLSRGPHNIRRRRRRRLEKQQKGAKLVHYVCAMGNMITKHERCS